jgi:hypothetical protein
MQQQNWTLEQLADRPPPSDRPAVSPPPALPAPEEEEEEEDEEVEVEDMMRRYTKRLGGTYA